MIAVDTNTIAYLLLEGEHTQKAREAYRLDTDWVAPTLWRSEFWNVLVLYLRQGDLKVEQALRFAAEAEHIMAGGEYAVTAEQVLPLANESGCSAYDSEFVALARSLGVRLLTSDSRILQLFPTTAISLGDYVDRGQSVDPP